MSFGSRLLVLEKNIFKMYLILDFDMKVFESKFDMKLFGSHLI